MKPYITDRLIYDPAKANGFSREEGPIIEARDLEHAEAMAESYGVEVVGVEVQFEIEMQEYEQ